MSVEEKLANLEKSVGNLFRFSPMLKSDGRGQLVLTDLEELRKQINSLPSNTEEKQKVSAIKTKNEFNPGVVVGADDGTNTVVFRYPSSPDWKITFPNTGEYPMDYILGFLRSWMRDHLIALGVIQE